MERLYAETLHVNSHGHPGCCLCRFGIQIVYAFVHNYNNAIYLCEEAHYQQEAVGITKPIVFSISNISKKADFSFPGIKHVLSNKETRKALFFFCNCIHNHALSACVHGIRKMTKFS